MFVILTFANEGDREKFEAIYEKYKGLMLHKAYGILRDYMLAEDAASEAFIRIYRNLDKLDGALSPQTASFVVTVVKNVALTMLEKERRGDSGPVDEESPDDFDLEGHILSEVAADDIYTLLDELGEELRGVFLLKYAHDLSHREIGRMLDISENNVTVRLHRARKKLAVILEREGYAVGQQ